MIAHSILQDELHVSSNLFRMKVQYGVRLREPSNTPYVVFGAERVNEYKILSIYLLLAKCEVSMASYGPSFFLPLMAQA